MNKDNFYKWFVVFVLLVALVTVLSGCDREANIASRNVSRAADSFEIYRRIVVINDITDSYLFTIEGLCSLGNFDPNRELSVTCKVGPNTYYKHFIGLADNVSYISEQIQPANVDPWHYRIIFRPSEIIPDIDIQTP